MNFKMNSDFEKQVRAVADRAVKDEAVKIQRLFDSLNRRYAGQPIEVIKPVLKREWQRNGGTLTDPELTEYATHISNGTKIRIRTR